MQMKWGPAFADMCVKERVKLVNYPVGLKEIGAPNGVTSVYAIHIRYLKMIVGP